MTVFMFKKIKIKQILAAVFLLFLLGRCAYSVGYPWNCAEAEEALKEAQKEYSEALESKPTEDAEIRFRVATDKRMRAEIKVSALCYSKP